MTVEEQRREQSRVTLFISFDLVNCTLYKSKHKGNWVYGVSRILDYIMGAFVHSPIGGYRFWKMLGDEVVYTKQIEAMTEIGATIDEVYRAVRDINQKIKSAEIGDATTAKTLSAKATVWIADISPANLCADNVYVEYEINRNELKVEYLGTDIDGGFRIAPFTSSNRLVISADLAALLQREQCLRPYFRHVHFVAFRILKGIWNGASYPIFMYHGDETTAFQDSILQSGGIKSAILKDYLEQSPQRVTDAPYTCYEDQLLDTLYRQPNLEREVNQLVDIIRTKEKNRNH